jgi:hypothetical protein
MEKIKKKGTDHHFTFSAVPGPTEPILGRRLHNPWFISGVNSGLESENLHLSCCFISEVIIDLTSLCRNFISKIKKQLSPNLKTQTLSHGNNHTNPLIK